MTKQAKNGHSKRKTTHKIAHSQNDQRTENIAEVFISYSHAAKDYMLIFRKHLEGLLFGKATIWSDEAIPRGKRWETALQAQIKRTDAALVLVTPDYLASTWCRKELAEIAKMEKDKTGSKRAFWVLVEPSGWRRTELTTIQTWDDYLKAPLTTLADPHQRELAIVKICEEIAQGIDTLRGDINPKYAFVRQVLKDHSNGKEIDLDPHPITQGQFATVCRARLDGKDVVIKVLRRLLMEKLAEEFAVYVNARQTLTHHCFIPLLEYFHLDYGYEHYIVMVEEYVKVKPLDDYLKPHEKTEGTVKIGDAILVLRRAAAALKEFHEVMLKQSQKDRRLEIKPYGHLTRSNTYYDETNQKLLLPAVGTTNFLLHAKGWEHADSWQDTSGTIAAYIAPEQAPNARHTQPGPPAPDKIDQYMLGQLAFEMLEGKLPFTVEDPFDVERQKKAFWDHPEREAKGAWKNAHPAFAKIIFKMLQRNPQERWKDFDELLSRLRMMEDENRALAKRSYQALLSKGEFFERFYDNFFTSPHGKTEAVQKLEGLKNTDNGIGMTRQAQKLKEAMIAVLNYYPGNEPTLLSQTVLSHCGLYKVSLDDVTAFLEAFETTLERELPLDKPKDGWHGTWDKGAIIRAWKELFSPVVECFHEAIKKREEESYRNTHQGESC